MSIKSMQAVTLSRLRSQASGASTSNAVPWGLGLFLLLLYDGALRKWILPNAEQLLFMVKDVLLSGLLVYTMLNRPRQIKASIPPAVLVPFLL